MKDTYAIVVDGDGDIEVSPLHLLSYAVGGLDKADSIRVGRGRVLARATYSTRTPYRNEHHIQLARELAVAPRRGFGREVNFSD